jgi:hypothetical protein
MYVFQAYQQAPALFLRNAELSVHVQNFCTRVCACYVLCMHIQCISSPPPICYLSPEHIYIHTHAHTVHIVMNILLQVYTYTDIYINIHAYGHMHT